MDKHIIIEIPAEFDFWLEIRNELTKVLDKYRIKELTDRMSYYDELLSTYIHIDELDIGDLLEIKEPDECRYLAFRLVGATRGAFLLKEIKRTDIPDDNIIKIDYTVTSVEFIESTCFGKLKAYTDNIIKESNDEIIGTNITISINK